MKCCYIFNPVLFKSLQRSCMSNIMTFLLDRSCVYKRWRSAIMKIPSYPIFDSTVSIAVVLSSSGTCDLLDRI